MTFKDLWSTFQEVVDQRPKPFVAHRPIPLANLDPDAVKVVRRLVRHDHMAYLVGGCVRDLLLGCQPKDFDVATSARPPELRRLFRNCRIIGRRFRLAHMMFRDGKIIEVATFRRDPPESTDRDDLLLLRDNFFGDPHEDALRRDFTINALFYDLIKRKIIDFAGGLKDIESRLLRTIGDPNIRFQEDPVRMLRAIKFTARQDLGMDPAVYEAALRHRGLLNRAAPARLLEEILRLLRGGAAHRSIWLAHEMGFMAEIIPELDRYISAGFEQSHQTFSTLQAVDAMMKNGQLPSDAVLLASLLHHPLREAMVEQHDQGRAVRDTLRPMAERLVMPRRIRDRIRQILVAQRRLTNPDQVRRTGLPRRDFFSDAIDFCEISMRCKDRSEQEIRRWRSQISPKKPPRNRKKPYRRPHRVRRS